MLLRVAEDASGRALACASYSSGRGYGAGPLRLAEFISTDQAGTAAVLRSAAPWDSVTDHLLWRGPTGDIALRLPGSVSHPEAAQPWMLRVLESAPAGDLPLPSARGLALLYAGGAIEGRLLREGLLDQPAPGLATAFAWPPPTLLDYF